MYLSSIALTLIGGCLSEDEPVPGLDELTIYNAREVESETTILVRKDGEQVYEEKYRLEPHDINSRSSVVIEEPWMGENAQYEVIIDVDNHERNTYSTNKFLEMAGSTEEIKCFEVSVRIEDGLIDFLPNAETECSNHI